MWIEMFGGSIYDDHVDILKADRFHCCNYLFRGWLCISENMLLWLITLFYKFPPIKNTTRSGQKQKVKISGTEAIAGRHISKIWSPCDEILTKNTTWNRSRGVDGPGMSKEGFLLFLKKTHLPLDAPNVGPLPFLLGDLEFWILLGFQGIRNSELCFFLAEISGWQRGRKPCFVAESPSSCDMYRVRTESQLLGWSRMTDWHRLGKSGKSKAKRPSQKSEELQSWLVWEWILNLTYLWIESYSFFWWVL